jgi:hypothetical protein
MTIDEVRARVFISCGQWKGTDEVRIAEAIRDALRTLGFNPYIAVLEQTLMGLTHNIYDRLRNSEYFLFVDFKRELLFGHGTTLLGCLLKTGDRRGSLFSHQELAIASFLNLDVLAFQESGVKSDDGIIRFLQTNATSFNDRNTLVDLVVKSVRQRMEEGSWDPTWRNELVLEPVQGPPSDAHILSTGGIAGPEARFFHINVRNRHRTKIATNCYAYLEKADRTKPSPQTFAPRTVEFKWAGTGIPAVGIAPRSERPFDAFFLLHSDPTAVIFNAHMDSTEFLPRLQGEGEYELAYSVISENFPPARGLFRLNLNRALPNTTFTAGSG